MPAWTPRAELCSASQERSFARESTVKRWPIILTGIVDELAKINGDLVGSQDANAKDKEQEGKKLINQIGELIYEMRHDRALTPLEPTGPPEDAYVYNTELAQLKEKNQDKWFTAPWLYAECYLYRRLHALFAVTQHWSLFDPFASQKLSTWKSSASGAAALAKSLEALVSRAGGKVPQPPFAKEDEDKLRVDFLALAEACLWGNATDLSLLTSLSHDEIQALQSVERGKSFLLKDDFEKAWEHVKELKGGRVDFVLDNSGFELFTDLCLADWLVTLSPFVSEVVIHPKLIPWFVSDVQPHDFTLLLSTLCSRSPSYIFADASLSPDETAALDALAERWNRYVDEGTFRLSVPKELKMGEKGGEAADFWTSPLPFSDLPSAAPALLADLKVSDLVLFKGDLNYRKLVSDAWWPTTHPFDAALGPLAFHFPILSLRTCKADTVCGLEESVEERVEREDEGWRKNGKYAVVSFVPADASKVKTAEELNRAQ
ncbi:hypothetical protein JCM8097_006813 [Rhodosporidiobolus ruineniae]